MKLSVFKKSLFALFLSTTILSAQAATNVKEYAPDSRSQLPPSLDNTYIGFGAGYTDIPFSNSNLINGQQATSFDNPNFGLNVFIGHYFNPYIAAEISLMRPAEWSYAYNVSGPSTRNSIWTSVFGISLRPTLPVTTRLDLYGIAGLGIVSRHGFDNNNGVTAIPSTDLMTFLTGGGISYALTSHWHWDTGVEYALAQPSKQEPNILYAFTGFHYIFTKVDLPEFYKTNYIFHKNLIQVSAFSTSVFDPDVNKYFTVGYLPIFWSGEVGTRDGEMFSYERNVFHTHKIFSFDFGVSASNYHSSVNDTAFQAFSIFPEFRFWFLRYPTFDMYFMYSVAGPSYITQTNIDNIYIGGNFSFQDLMGIGAFIGKEKHINIAATIGHYSNGNLLPNNPGIEVPLMFSLGYAF